MARPLVAEWRLAVHRTNRLPWHAKTVALHLSCVMDSRGFGMVGADTIAARAGIGRTSVFEGLKALRARGWVEVRKRRIRKGVGGCVNTYQATFPDWLEPSASRTGPRDYQYKRHEREEQKENATNGAAF